MFKTLRKTSQALVIGTALTVAPLTAAAHSLADSLVQAYNHSGLLEQNRAVLRAADEDVAGSLAALRPVVNFIAQAGYSDAAPRDKFSASWTLEASMLLYDFGASKMRTEALKETVLATRQSLIGIEQRVLQDAVAAFMDVRRRQEFAALRASNVRLITRELRAAEDRFEVGEVTRTDVALAEARLASARAALAGAQGELAQAIAEYTRAVGAKPGALNTPTTLPDLPRSVEAAIGIARRTHPDILATQHQIAAAELSIAIAEAGLRGTVTGSASLSANDSDTASKSIGLRATLPLYSGGRLQSEVRKAQANRDAARAGLHVTRHAIDQQVTNAYALRDIARATREAGDRQVRAATIAFRGVREEATLGARTTLDVLDAEQELLDAQVNVISARVDETTAAYRILATMGLLTAKHLGLPVKTYDPAAYYNLVKDAPTATSDQGKALERVLLGINKN